MPFEHKKQYIWNISKSDMLFKHEFGKLFENSGLPHSSRQVLVMHARNSGPETLQIKSQSEMTFLEKGLQPLKKLLDYLYKQKWQNSDY